MTNSADLIGWQNNSFAQKASFNSFSMGESAPRQGLCNKTHAIRTSRAVHSDRDTAVQNVCDEKVIYVKLNERLGKIFSGPFKCINSN